MNSEVDTILNGSRKYDRRLGTSGHPLFDTLHLIQAKIRLSFFDKVHASSNMQQEIMRRFEADTSSALWTLKVFYPELSHVPEDEVWQRIKDDPSKLNHDIANFLLDGVSKAFFSYLFNQPDVTSEQRLYLDRLHIQHLTHPTTLPSDPSCSKK